MSGGPSKEPACLGVDYSGKFFNPNSSAGDYNVTYQPDEDVQIAWFGGKKTPGAVLHVTLFLVPYDSRLNVMIIFGKLSHHKLSTSCRKSWFGRSAKLDVLSRQSNTHIGQLYHLDFGR